MDEDEVVKKKNPNFLYLYGRGAKGVNTSESQDILFQLRVGFAGKFGKPFSGKNVRLDPSPVATLKTTKRPANLVSEPASAPKEKGVHSAQSCLAGQIAVRKYSRPKIMIHFLKKGEIIPFICRG